MNQTRQQYRARFFGLTSLLPRPKVKRVKREPRRPDIYEFDGQRVKALTKSEARALFKKKLGLKRLPAGATPQRITDND